jgi:putative oxidoreductase
VPLPQPSPKVVQEPVHPTNIFIQAGSFLQIANAEHLKDKLGWESVYAWNDETFGPAGTAGFFVSIGLPAWLAYVTICAETIGGTLLVLGWHTRVAALALIPTLLGAIIWVHAPNGWVFSNKGGGWEYPAFLILASVVLALLGDGAYASSRRVRARH